MCTMRHVFLTAVLLFLVQDELLTREIAARPGIRIAAKLCKQALASLSVWLE